MDKNKNHVGMEQETNDAMQWHLMQIAKQKQKPFCKTPFITNSPNTDAILTRITKNTTSDMLGKSFCFLRIFVAINSIILNIECLTKSVSIVVHMHMVLLATAATMTTTGDGRETP